VAFDLVESENQHFLLDVTTKLFASDAAAPAEETKGEGEAKVSGIERDAGD
jgi:hypothetical protein